MWAGCWKDRSVSVESSSVFPAATFDVRRQPHEDVLARIERTLDVRLDRASVIYGAYGTTEGFRSDRGTWVRVERRPRWHAPDSSWVGVEASSALRGVRRPDWLQSTAWVDIEREQAWRADELESVESPSVTAAGGVEAAARLPESWWRGVRESLAVLATQQTRRVAMSQAHLSTRIGQVFTGVDTKVEEWATAHGDLHWGNVTIDGHLIDWTDWGAAPRGHDAASLWQASLSDETLATRVRCEFSADLETRSGKLARLLRCANVIRIAAQRGTSTPLVETAGAAAVELLADLGS